MSDYTIHHDNIYEVYDIVRIDDGAATTVQTNIPCHDKALHALALWRERDKLHDYMREMEATAVKLRSNILEFRRLRDGA